LSESVKRIRVQVKRDFLPLVRLLESAEIVRRRQNDFDEPVIGNFAKYAVSRGSILLTGKSFDRVTSEARKCILEMICKALKVEMDDVSELDFSMAPRDPRLFIMNLGLKDGTQIIVPLIDRAATREE